MLNKLDVATMPPEGVEVDVGNGIRLIKSKVRHHPPDPYTLATPPVDQAASHAPVRRQWRCAV